MLNCVNINNKIQYHGTCLHTYGCPFTAPAIFNILVLSFGLRTFTLMNAFILVFFACDAPAVLTFRGFFVVHSEDIYLDNTFLLSYPSFKFLLMNFFAGG